MGQHLVYAPSRHDVTAKKNPRACDLALSIEGCSAAMVVGDVFRGSLNRHDGGNIVFAVRVRRAYRVERDAALTSVNG